jgi:hypothetical protein
VSRLIEMSILQAILHHDKPLAFAETNPVHSSGKAQKEDSRLAMAAASIKRLTVRHQALALKAPTVPVARSSKLQGAGVASGYNSEGSDMGHAAGFLGQYYFLGENMGPSGFAEYDNVKPTAESFPHAIDFKNSNDFKAVDAQLENGQIAARWVGKIEIKKDGNYQFQVASTDSAWVYIDGQLAVEAKTGDGTVTSDGIFLSQGYHAFRAEFFSNTNAEKIVIKYKGADTDDDWKLVEGVHRTDFDYLNALSLTNLPDPVKRKLNTANACCSSHAALPHF